MSSDMESAVASPRTVDEARHAVERSRQRISTTLDQLEEKIVEKRAELEEKVDVLRPVKDQIRERPFTAVAVGLGVGALLGSLGGRDAERGSSSRSSRDNAVMSDEERRELREWRKMRRERLEARMSVADRGGRSGRNSHEASEPGRLDAMKNQLMGAITSAIGAAVTAKVKEMTGLKQVQQARAEGRADGRAEATARDW